MTAELVRGQNHPLPGARWEIRVSAGEPIVAGATLNDEAGVLREAGWIAHPAAPRLPGLEVSRQAAADHRLAVDLDAVPEQVHRVNVLLALPAGVGGPTAFAGLAAPVVTVTGLGGEEVAGYRISGLDAESAVVAVELYRRQGGWRVRAVGQGYAGGLAAMLADQGLDRAGELAATINEAVAGGISRSVAAPPPRAEGERTRHGAAPSTARQSAEDGPGPAPSPSGSLSHTASDTASDWAPDTASGGAGIDYRHPRRRSATLSASPPPSAPSSTPSGTGGSGAPAPVAGDATGWSMDERLYNQVWGMFEDMARAVAAYRSAVDFAESRRDQEVEKVLSDPATRVGPAADAARSEARGKHARLAAEARAALDRDLRRLDAEAQVVEPALPPAYARWDNPVWRAYKPPEEAPMAIRLGDLSLPEGGALRIPMLMRLPLERGLWIDSGRTGSGAEAAVLDSGELRHRAAETATAIAARLAAAHPAGGLALHVIDPAGSAAEALAPLARSGVLRDPPAAGAQGVTRTLEHLTRRVDLVQMAVRSGATDALPPDVNLAEQLLVVHDFPHGFDDRSVTRLRYLADEGGAVGVTLMMVADRADARAYGPVLDPLWRSLLRLTPVPDDHLGDPWVGHHWTYEPPLAPSGSRIVSDVLGEVAVARRGQGS